MKKVICYECSICGEQYDTEAKCGTCEEKGLEKPIVAVGDIVRTGRTFGWFNGNRRWIINPDVKQNPAHGNCFNECCCMVFYYVVTAIDRTPEDRHCLRYHLFTKAMSGQHGYRDGFTFSKDHYTPVVIKDPPVFVIKDSKDLIGSKSEYLI